MNLIIRINVSSEALQDSKYIDDLDHIVHCFDKTTKPYFRNANEAQYVKFGSSRDNDALHNIRFGRLKLYGWVISTEILLIVIMTHDNI